MLVMRTLPDVQAAAADCRTLVYDVPVVARAPMPQHKWLQFEEKALALDAESCLSIDATHFISKQGGHGRR